MAEVPPAARLLTGATVLSPARAPEGTAVATVGDRIAAVGPPADCHAALRAAGVADVTTLDLTGRTLVPGFVDAHLHPMVMCVFEQQLLLDEVRSLSELADLLADRVATTPDGETVVGFQLDGELLAERRLPTAVELDAVAGDRPVVLLCRDGHHAVASTAALVAGGLMERVPTGGHVARDRDGRPSGLVGERAVEPLMALMPDVTIEGLVDGLTSWTDRLLRQGITSISAMCQTTAEGPAGAAGELEAFGWAALSGDLPFDIQTILITPEPDEVLEARDPSLHDPARGRRLDAVKLFLDGTLGGRTACMHHGFADDPHQHGMRTLTDDEALRRVEAAHLAGLQVCIHAIGDAANHAAADLLGGVIERHPGPHRHRVEHASVLDDHTIERFAELGVTAVVQPINLRSERHWLSRRVGADRMARTYAFRSLLDAGVAVAGSSDAPIERTDVLAAMGAAVDRRGQADEQAISREEALALFTTGGSRARGTEDQLGAIAADLRADLVVLDADPSDAGVELDRVRVLATLVAGEPRHLDPSLDPGWTTQCLEAEIP